MKMSKRIWSLLLAAVMTASLLVMPAAAAQTTAGFADITDANVAVAVESLRLMGVLDGYGDGTFRPGNTLTRAQFCKMAVFATNGGTKSGQYKTYTIYPDVKSSHWAAAYVNMAAKGMKIILGYPDGKFYPDRTVSYSQAVTILMRLLGYADTDVGAVWPNGYLAAAQTIGLTKGVTASADAPLTRGQAAILFGNLLAAKTKDGKSYASTIATTTVANVVLLSSSATGPDGLTGAMQTADATYAMAGKTSNGLLNGRKGTLLLDANDRVLTFAPTASGTTKTVTAASAGASYLTDTTGVRYTLGANVVAYADGKKQSWGEAYAWATAGTSVTIYLGESGNAEYVFVGGGTATAAAAVIVSSNGSSAGFSAIAGGNANYNIVKNGAPATVADLRQYDVATYDGATNTIRVCDTRITGIYENCWPNTSEPGKVTVLGHEFTVLPSGAANFSGFKLSSPITLLLTADNQVAGAVASSGTMGTSNAVGMVESASATSAKVRLLCGITVTGNPQMSGAQAENMAGKLVRVSSGKKGTLALSLLTSGSNSSLDLVNRKVGSAALAANVLVYEKVNEGPMTSISLGDITEASVSASKVSYVGKDWAGRVNLLVLNDVTGNCYTYGRADVGTGDQTSTLSVAYGNGSATPAYENHYYCANGSYVGVAAAASGSRVTALVALEGIKNVPNSAWSGKTSVSAGGSVYTVPEDVVCYNKASGGFLTLSAARAFAEKSNLYVDSHGVVRVIEVS